MTLLLSLKVIFRFVKEHLTACLLGVIALLGWSLKRSIDSRKSQVDSERVQNLKDGLKAELRASDAVRQTPVPIDIEEVRKELRKRGILK